MSEYVNVDAVLACTTAEEVIIALKALRYGRRDDDYTSPVFGDSRGDKLTAALAVLGIPEAAPSPDEAPLEARVSQ